VVDGLNGLAIDLSRSLSPTLPEKLMSAFVAGDRGVFVRRVLSMDLGGDAPLLRAKYRDDPVFRGHVDAYVRQFESLRAASVAADPDAILTAAFLTSDIGKLYMFLSAAIERPDAAGLPPPGA
jgi:nicotinamide riboside kinase